MTINQNGLFFEIFFIFLYCKIVISFLELFSATYFLFILQTQLTRRNTSIPKKHRHMTFMMTSLNDNKSDICHFFYQDLFHITNTVYAQNFLRYSMFFHRRPTSPDQGMVNQRYSFFSRAEKNKYHSILSF